MTLEIPTVAIYQGPGRGYSESPPFNPDEDYPDYIFAGRNLVGKENAAYHGIRESFRLLGLDRDKFGASDWNPLSVVVKPGDAVLVKPNAVMHVNLKPGETVLASITHGSAMRAVVDYAYKALNGKGKITIADAPLAQCDFGEWLRLTGLEKVVELYRSQLGFEIEVLDLRTLFVPWDEKYDFAPSHLRVRGVRDPAGYVEVELDGESAFAELSDDTLRRLYGADFNRTTTVDHHIEGHHQYHVAKSVLESSVLISVPKLKVHSKVGVTLNIKGMVGTQGDKNYIPHFRLGQAGKGGDESPNQGLLQNILNRYRIWLHTRVLARETASADLAYKVLSRIYSNGQRILWKLELMKRANGYAGPIQSGAWHGNDTAWRMAIDLIRIILYADADGNLHNVPQRRFFSVIDGIIGGEDEGPLSPTTKPCGVIVSGFNPLSVDLVATRLMGFDPSRVRMLADGLRQPWLKLWPEDAAAIPIQTNVPAYESMMSDQTSRFLAFVPSKGWRHYLEAGVKHLR